MNKGTTGGVMMMITASVSRSIDKLPSSLHGSLAASLPCGSVQV